MKNAIIVITGQKGSGKTTFTKALLAQVQRSVVADRLLEYQGEVVTGDFGKAVSSIADRWEGGKLSTVARFRSDLRYTLLFHFLAECSAELSASYLGPNAPLLLCVEEVDHFATPQSIDKNLYDLVAYGRHANISLLAVVRADTDTNRILLNNADCVVLLRQHRFSVHMQRKLDIEDQQLVERLETLTPGINPQYGKHYITTPANTDPFNLLYQALRGEKP